MSKRCAALLLVFSVLDLNNNHKLLSSQQFYEYQYKELKDYCTNLPTEFDEFWQNYVNVMQNAKFNDYLGEIGL